MPTSPPPPPTRSRPPPLLLAAGVAPAAVTTTTTVERRPGDRGSDDERGDDDDRGADRRHRPRGRARSRTRTTPSSRRPSSEVEAFWAEEFPAVFGGDFEPVDGRLHPLRPRPRAARRAAARSPTRRSPRTPSTARATTSSPGTPTTSPNDLLAEFGAVLPRHRDGPRVRPRHPGPGAGRSGPTIATEQQADCFAGAFTAFVDDGGSDVLSVSIDDLDSVRRRLPDPPRRSSARPPTTRRPTARPSTASARSRTASSTAPTRCAEYEEIFDARRLDGRSTCSSVDRRTSRPAATRRSTRRRRATSST